MAHWLYILEEVLTFVRFTHADTPTRSGHPQHHLSRAFDRPTPSRCPALRFPQPRPNEIPFHHCPSPPLWLACQFSRPTSLPHGLPTLTPPRFLPKLALCRVQHAHHPHSLRPSYLRLSTKKNPNQSKKNDSRPLRPRKYITHWICSKRNHIKRTLAILASVLFFIYSIFTATISLLSHLISIVKIIINTF